MRNEEKASCWTDFHSSLSWRFLGQTQTSYLATSTIIDAGNCSTIEAIAAGYAYSISLFIFEFHVKSDQSFLTIAKELYRTIHKRYY